MTLTKEQQIKSYIEEFQSLERQLEANPEDYSIYAKLGWLCYDKLKNNLKALGYYMNYVNYVHNDAIAYNMIGHLLCELDPAQNVDDQIYYFELADKHKPNDHNMMKNLTLVYPRAGRYQEALEYHKKILKSGATMDDYFDYACLNIKLSNWKEGWKYYEYRFSKEHGATPLRKFDKPLWKKQKIKDKTLLVHWEQGFGDTIMFCRYLPRLAQRCKKLIFVVQDPLVSLIQDNYPDVEVVADSKAKDIEYDYYLPLMSCMERLGEKPTTIPDSAGYLKASTGLKEYYKEKYFNNDNLKIGISWAGAKGGNERRNIPLEAFRILTELEGVQVYSIQKDAKIPEDMNIIELGSTFKSFDDTAGAMANLDVFITGDNVLLNLAGAMGVKTVCLLNQYSEWRWFNEGGKCSWYDSVWMWQKEKEKDSWQELVNRVLEVI